MARGQIWTVLVVVNLKYTPQHKQASKEEPSTTSGIRTVRQLRIQQSDPSYRQKARYPSLIQEHGGQLLKDKFHQHVCIFQETWVQGLQYWENIP